MKEITNTVTNTLIYSLGNISVKIIGLLLLPLYTSKLSVGDYGKLGLLEVTAQFLIVVCSFNIYSAMIRWYSEQENIVEKKTIVFNSYFPLFILITIINIILIPQREFFANLYFGSSEFAQIFLYLFISVSFEILNNITFSLFRVQEKPGKYIFFMLGKLILILGLNIYFVAFAEWGVSGIFLSAAIGNIIMFLGSLPVIFVNMNVQFRWNLLKEMFQYGFPLIFSSVSMMLLSMGDRFIIKYYLADEQVGIYTLAYKIAGVLNMILIQSFALSFLPIAYKMIHHEKSQEFYQKILHYFSVVLVLFAFVLSLFAREILEIFTRNSDYWIAYYYVPLLCIAFVLKGIQYIFSLGLHYVKQTKNHAYVVMSGVAINFGLNFLLIPIMNIWGAVLTTLLSSLYITIMFYHIAQKKFYIPYQLKKLFVVVLIPIALYFTSFIIKESFSFLHRIIIKSILFLILVSFFYYMKIIDKDIIKVNRAIIKSIVKEKE
jgi:O-antigen/teichoic acid export membrane protein